MKKKGITMLCMAVAICACEVIDNDMDKHVDNRNDSTYVALEDVASILSSIPLRHTHMEEVYSAVEASSGNGYDEEYTMKSLFESPGTGVGDKATKGSVITDPLRELIEEHVRSGAFTKASSSSAVDPDAFLAALTSSDVQIYWPFSQSWNGEDMPVITFDPENGAETNIGYKLVLKDDGTRRVEEVVVTEEMAEERPVWIVNRNSDAEFTSLEMLRREDPAWGEGGGAIIIDPHKAAHTKAGAVRSLILKDFTMKRNYDSWFAGASEFFVKVGAVEDFTASTEAELQLYNPTVTDFMVVVRRNQLGKPQPFNAVLVSDWTDQMVNCAFMITEDDGGTRTEWDCTALVRIASKSYGFEVKLPFNSRDDIVWRGQLAGKWLEATSDMVGHFGDVDLTFEVVEY